MVEIFWRVREGPCAVEPGWENGWPVPSWQVLHRTAGHGTTALPWMSGKSSLPIRIPTLLIIPPNNNNNNIEISLMLVCPLKDTSLRVFCLFAHANIKKTILVPFSPGSKRHSVAPQRFTPFIPQVESSCQRTLLSILEGLCFLQVPNIIFG